MRAADFSQVAQEIRDLAMIFEVRDRGEQLIAELETTLSDADSSRPQGKEPTVAWVHSTINGAPIVAGSSGLAQEIGQCAGIRYVFADLAKQWAESSAMDGEQLK